MKANRYEEAWIVFSILTILLFLGITAIYAFGAGFEMPHEATAVDPQNLPPQYSSAAQAQYGSPQVQEIIPGKKYVVYMVARQYRFSPDPLKVPAGAEITIHITSPDVTHGMEIIGSNVNVMIIPGYVSTVTTKFDKPGEYAIICHEYCGAGHHFMQGKLIVEGSAR